MKIVHFINTLAIGGAECLLVDIVNMQVVNNNEVHIIYSRENKLNYKMNKGIYLHEINLNPLEVYRILKKIKPDILHTHLIYADILGLFAGRLLKIKKTFTTIHSTYFRKKISPRIYFKIYEILFNFINPQTKIIAISNSVKNVVINQFKINPSRVHLVYNAISKKNYTEIKETDFYKKFPISSQDFCLLFVGRLTKSKGLSYLLNAIKIINDESIKLIIVGDGEEREKLYNLTLELNLQSNVCFVGEKKNVEYYYSISNLFVLPSTYEGFGLVLLEAFQAKLPVIASKIDGPSEIIKEGYNGILFENKNITSLSEKIKLIKKDKLLRQTLAINGFNTYNELFTMEKLYKNLTKVYNLNG